MLFYKKIKKNTFLSWSKYKYKKNKGNTLIIKACCLGINLIIINYLPKIIKK